MGGYVCAEVFEFRRPEGTPPFSAAAHNYSKLAATDACVLETVWIESFIVLDRVWLEKKASYMQFNAIMALVKNSVKQSMGRRGLASVDEFVSILYDQI